jgi:3-deoxy-manno-octulosonate cytidylyltransferase (CMP-KDO synthetase)
MNILAVIPARYASQRFPGKPLITIGDRPMIQWVYEAAKRCPHFTKVIVATDDSRIMECVSSFGGVEMTSDQHTSGTDRVAEVAQRYPDAEVLVNVQGDQPLVTPQMLAQLIDPYLNPTHNIPDVATLACPLDFQEGYSDPNVVKVIINNLNDAMYFSRSPIPYFRIVGPAPVFQHLGLYAFQRNFLMGYSTLTPSSLEACEGLEQLRILENGYKIRVSHAEASIPEVNTPEDLGKIQEFLLQNEQF